MKIFNLLLVFLMLSLIVVVGGCSNFELSALELSPEVCVAGETVTVSATVIYSGDVVADYEAELKVDGVVEQTRTFTFDPLSAQALSFNLTKDEPGRYKVQVGGLEATLTVLGASNIEISPNEVEVDQPVTVTADLQNVTGDEVVYRCCLFCQGEEVQSKSVTMAANSTAEVSFTLSQSSAGYYDVEFLGLSDSFRVLKPAEFVVSDFVVAPNPVKVGGVATVTADIENVGEVGGTEAVSLLVDGAIEDTREITLSGGAATTQTFDLSRNTAGGYSLQLGDQQAELVVVQPVRPSSGTVLLDEFTRSGDSRLKVFNHREWDVVVVLASSEEPEIPVWAGYVRADDYHSFARMARGTYILYYTFGEDWLEETKEFLTVYSYNRFAGETTLEDAGYTYTIWTVTFGITSGEGSASWSLDEDEFPSLE